MGSAWGALTQTAKDEYAAKAKELKKAFDVEYKKWYETLTPETIKAIEKASGKKVSLPGGRAAYKKEQAARPGNPGRPLSAFFEFLKEFREKEGKSLQDIKEVARKAGEKWRQMSDAEKQVSGRGCRARGRKPGEVVWGASVAGRTGVWAALGSACGVV
jgi:dihydroxyacetone kinase